MIQFKTSNYQDLFYDLLTGVPLMLLCYQKLPHQVLYLEFIFEREMILKLYHVKSGNDDSFTFLQDNFTKQVRYNISGPPKLLLKYGHKFTSYEIPSHNN